MAFFDDKKMLLSHIRHSFVVSDDTGMCELIMVKEDVEQEIENDKSFNRKSARMIQRYRDKGMRSVDQVGVQSFDIRASPSPPRRPPLKDDSNMFEGTGEKKMKKKSGKSTLITWRESPRETNSNLFKPQPVVKNHPVKSSPLTRLLAEQQRKTSNPFFNFQKFNGENHEASSTSNFKMFLSMAKDPLKPVNVTVLHNAVVEDLIGLTFWKFLDEEREKLSFKPVSYYSVMIAEDDGEIDTDLPELQREDHIARFGFKYLGIVERSDPVKPLKNEEDSKKHKIVRVYYEDGGFSTIGIDSMDIEMSEILTKVMRKRRLQIHGYELEHKNYPGQFVDLSSDLKSQGTMDFVLKHIPRYSFGENDIDGSTSKQRSFTQVKVQLTSHEYKSFNVMMLHKVRSNTKVQLGVDYEHVEIQPVDQSGRGFLKLKPVRYDIQDIHSSVVLNEEKQSGSCIFRITRMTKEGFKNIDFEAPVNVAKEIVAKISLILNDTSNNFSQNETEDRKERDGLKRKASRTTAKHD